MSTRVRIAPSPTGYPHIGTIWQALINWAFAKKYNGQFIVRIEDTDRERLVEDAEKKLFSALDWFGLNPDESSKHKGRFGPYRQSERLPLYKKYAQKLVEKGHAYWCFCSPKRLEKVRKQKQKAGLPPMYDKKCRNIPLTEAKEMISKGAKHVIRLKVPEKGLISVNDLIRGEIKFNAKIVDDQVLLKSDGYPTYHLAVVVDDHLMKITHMVRGEEWLSSAPKQVLVYEFLGWQKPIFVHTPILRNLDKSKLSKRQGHAAVSWYKEQGYLPEAVLNFLSLLGWAHPQEKTIFPLEEFVKYFEFKDLSPVGPVVDLKKLDFINSHYIKNLKEEEFIKLIKKYLDFEIEDKLLKKIIPLLRERISRLSEAEEMVSFLFKKPEAGIDSFKGEEEVVKKELEQVRRALEDLKTWDKNSIYKACKQVFKQGGFDKSFYKHLYIAIEGKEAGLPVFESMEILGKEKTLERLKLILSGF
jgi:glutamyl-tRNA synthetase